MRRSLAVGVILTAALVWFGCGDDTVAPPTGGHTPKTTCDSIATAWFSNLGDTLEALGDRSDEEIRNTRFNDIRAGFQQALSCDAGNAIASLGLSIIELLELNYDEDLWALVDSIDAWGGGGIVLPPFSLASEDRHRTLVGRQFELMVEVPAVMAFRMASIPPNITIGNMQQIIEDAVIPRINAAINRISAVERLSNPRFEICIDSDGMQECAVIDKGEILVFSASLRALRSAFRCMTAYDVDMFAPDGTYGWIEDFLSLAFSYPPYYWCASDYEVIEMGAIDDLNIYYEDLYSESLAQMDSIVVRVLHHNFANRSEFLGLRDQGQALAAAHADILATMDKLDAAATFIRNRTDESEDNIIKLADLTGLDAELGDPYGPNFAKSWTRVEDVFGFVDDLMSGPMEFTEEISPGVPYTWTMDLGNLFTSPVQNWKNLLPYHEWNLPAGDWITDQVILQNQWNNGGNDYWLDYYVSEDFCDYIVLPNIGIVSTYSRYWRFDDDTILLLLDGPGGNTIDPSVVFPYFPDYTLGGLFPEMDREAWIDFMALVQ